MNLLQTTAAVLLAMGCFEMLNPAIALAEEPPAKEAGASTANTGDQRPATQNEIIVAARKEHLRDLTRDVENSEDAFFDAYNHVNTVPAFAVHCSVETPLGTHISRRECRPKFVDTARETEAASILESLTEGSSSGGTLEPPHGATANEQINEKMRDYKKHVVEVATKDQNLRKMLQDYKELRKRYNATLKENMN